MILHMILIGVENRSVPSPSCQSRVHCVFFKMVYLWILSAVRVPKLEYACKLSIPQQLIASVNVKMQFHLNSQEI